MPQKTAPNSIFLFFVKWRLLLELQKNVTVQCIKQQVNRQVMDSINDRYNIRVLTEFGTSVQIISNISVSLRKHKIKQRRNESNQEAISI